MMYWTIYLLYGLGQKPDKISIFENPPGHGPKKRMCPGKPGHMVTVRYAQIVTVQIMTCNHFCKGLCAEEMKLHVTFVFLLMLQLLTGSKIMNSHRVMLLCVFCWFFTVDIVDWKIMNYLSDGERTASSWKPDCTWPGCHQWTCPDALVSYWKQEKWRSDIERQGEGLAAAGWAV